MEVAGTRGHLLGSRWLSSSLRIVDVLRSGEERLRRGSVAGLLCEVLRISGRASLCENMNIVFEMMNVDILRYIFFFTGDSEQWS